jgi:hypothetical protein
MACIPPVAPSNMSRDTKPDSNNLQSNGYEQVYKGACPEVLEDPQRDLEYCQCHYPYVKVPGGMPYHRKEPGKVLVSSSKIHNVHRHPS